MLTSYILYRTSYIPHRTSYIRKIFISFSLLISTITFGQTKDYPIQAVNFKLVHLTDNFWLPRIQINQRVTIPASFERCENTGRVKNFVMAAAGKGKFGTAFPFDDTDIYKTIEGASFSLSLFPDKKSESYIDSLIVIIGKAQEPDGYLYTARTIDPLHPHLWSGKERWEREREQSHELYNAGHLYEAAAAHYYATGKRTLLDIALKNADLVCSVFGPGKKHVAPGHEIIEMGLVKLYRIAGKKEYLETAKFFIDERGHYNGYDENSKDPFKNGSYWQDNKPVTEQDEAIGHAVRACYLYSGMADVAALTGDQGLLKSIDKIWENVTEKKMYVQGGIGAVPEGERFGDNYQLPNNNAYNETCAAIANVYWNYRMFLLHGDARYMDILEKSLYNDVISGVGLDGKSFFYSNAMQIKNYFSYPGIEPSRAGWFECSCCPTNLTRLIPSIPGYVYGLKDDNVYINLFMKSNTVLTVHNKPVKIIQQNNYPWDGALKFTVSLKGTDAFTLLIRIPGWAQNQAMPSDLYSFTNNPGKKAAIKVNGKPVQFSMDKGYAVIKKSWKKNDVIEVNLPMEVREVKANEKVKDDIGKIALQRGPVVYCAEWVDNNGKTSNIIIPPHTVFTTEYEPTLLGGVTVAKSNVPVIEIGKDGLALSTINKPFRAIPYYAWANRGKGEMSVWFPTRIQDLDIITNESAGIQVSK